MFSQTLKTGCIGRSTLARFPVTMPSSMIPSRGMLPPFSPTAATLGRVSRRALSGDIDRRQLAWVNQRHITEENIDNAITTIINLYNRFMLPKLWGSGERAAADGTKWDVYEQNLLSEYHIRYGGYGGIGYYHVSDTYIALFSHFIPCGVWEAVYILDGLLNNKSDIQPDTVHSDTQGQSAPVFALAHLLGIKLMPRIRNWKDLKLFRPARKARYQHIDGLFSDTIDWELIATHYDDMLRVAVSIKSGKLLASTILRKLGTYSRKNRLYDQRQLKITACCLNQKCYRREMCLNTLVASRRGLLSCSRCARKLRGVRSIDEFARDARSPHPHSPLQRA